MTADIASSFETKTVDNSESCTLKTNVNGLPKSSQAVTTSAEELSILLQAAINELIVFITKANQEQASHRNSPSSSTITSTPTSLVNPDSLNPKTLTSRLHKTLILPDHGTGLDGFLNILHSLLKYSVNSSAPGFLDKLYAAPLPPGIGAELILAVLNTNVHVYQVSPVLTLIEKFATRQLAALFGLETPRAGGIVVTGGSASNLTSIVVARNSLFPETKRLGNFASGRQLVMFTSAHGHYSIEKAAQALGFGSAAVTVVPTDSTGRMNPVELDRLIVRAKTQGQTSFYVNATAGTTVLGSFDPFREIAEVTRRHRCWLHVDGAWGGGFIFSSKSEFRAKMDGIELADSIAVNPHKMLGVPVTCSFLLTRDLRLFQEAMTLKAGYLFHGSEDDDKIQIHTDAETDQSKDTSEEFTNGTSHLLYDLRDENDANWTEPDDLADMTLQCGRRGDALKFFISWQYYGTAGYAQKVENAYYIAVYMNNLVDKRDDLTLVLGPGSKPSCLQVCFYYTPGGRFLYGLENEAGVLHHSTAQSKKDIGRQNTKLTSRISKALIPRGFMVDFAPALESQEDKGHFLRVVVNISTIRETAERLVSDVEKVGAVNVEELRAEGGSS